MSDKITDQERYQNYLKKTNNLIYDATSMHEFLMENMPGKWSKMHLTKLVKRLPGHENFFVDDTGKTECVRTTPDEVKRLLEVIDLKGIHKICEPFDGTGVISDVLREHTNESTQIITNDICPEHGNPMYCENALDANLYIKHKPEAIITSPWFVMLDVAIPLMMKHTKMFVACHVPGYYVTNPPNPRLDFLKKYSKLKLLYVIGSMPKDNPTRMSNIWLIIFSNREEAKKRMKNMDVILPIIL